MAATTHRIQHPVFRKPSLVADRLLLVSLLAVIVLAPILDHGEVRKVILTALTFIPAILATVELSDKKHWLWPSVLLVAVAIAFGVTSTLLHNRVLVVLKWATLAAFFSLSVAGLFSYFRRARIIQQSHLYTAVSVYLLLGMLWFTLYAALDTASPGSFQHSNSAVADRQSELLYFSLITLTTIGYGDILPLAGEARMLAALEGVTGVLYIAITVAILVSGFKRQDSSSSE